jgi:hypothetical protein
VLGSAGRAHQSHAASLCRVQPSPRGCPIMP